MLDILIVIRAHRSLCVYLQIHCTLLPQLVASSPKIPNLTHRICFSDNYIKFSQFHFIFFIYFFNLKSWNSTCINANMDNVQRGWWEQNPLMKQEINHIYFKTQSSGTTLVVIPIFHKNTQIQWTRWSRITPILSTISGLTCKNVSVFSVTHPCLWANHLTKVDFKVQDVLSNPIIVCNKLKFYVDHRQFVSNKQIIIFKTFYILWIKYAI